jgi:hypothetical protein
MQALVHLALALLNAGAPWLAAIVIVGIVLKWVGPIQLNLSKLNLSIGNAPSQKPAPAKRNKAVKRPSLKGNRANSGRKSLPPQA